MHDPNIASPQEIITVPLGANDFIPNNPQLPVLLYKKAIQTDDPNVIEKILDANGWKKPWRNGIYTFHHFHSNTHEVLCIYQGSCHVQLGGEGGPIFEVQTGDALILPVGVSHKNTRATADFRCLGAYPFSIDYDMQYGDHETKIQNVPLPKTDPIYGKTGPLFQYWKES